MHCLYVKILLVKNEHLNTHIAHQTLKFYNLMPHFSLSKIFSLFPYENMIVMVPIKGVIIHLSQKVGSGHLSPRGPSNSSLPAWFM
jgi:hypothetical protein